MREWLVIESSYKNAVFAPEDSRVPKGYIPRDSAEKLLGKDLGCIVWFSREESERMRAHPDWRETLPAVSDFEKKELEAAVAQAQEAFFESAKPPTNWNEYDRRLDALVSAMRALRSAHY